MEGRRPPFEMNTPMTWLNSFYSVSVAIPCSLALVAVISLLSWRKRGQQIIIALTLFLYGRYLLWRGLYTLNANDWASLLLSLAVYAAEAYAFVQVVLFAYHGWSPLNRKPVRVRTYPTVDIFVTVVNEPLAILRRTLIGCLHQAYPRERYRIYVLDDGQQEATKALAESLNCGYIRRATRSHAKAGNLNHALPLTSGEMVAIFDVDHVPTTSFLKDTVGFFEDRQVAFVQTPHHFHNADVFQKNLQLEGVLKNEQALFYRVLQAGRDRHNSAFFAGSCGIFRRRVLEEIGGFRTETVTEDIHTSMVIHARGYRSCYLNKVLATGLMPETFESTMKQRIRWTMGHVQILFRTNPLTFPGLTLPQRIGYFASIFYFFHGIPRLICLIAPLFALLLGIVPVMADGASLLNFFGSYYLAMLVMFKTASRGSRNAFWSDVYETADSVALAWATLRTAVRPWKERAFVITPKGMTPERRGLSRFSYVVPHLLIFGFLIAGLVTGLRALITDVPFPGLVTSLFWGATNLLLLSVAILAAAEIPEWRKSGRIGWGLPCILITADQQCAGVVKEINEAGALVRIPKPVITTGSGLLFSLKGLAGDRVTVEARIRRQTLVSASEVEVGLQFMKIDVKTADSLIATTFLDARTWNRPERDASISQSLWALFKVLKLLARSSRRSRRRVHRISYQQDCRFDCAGRRLHGSVAEISPSGMSVKLSCTVDLVADKGVLYMDGFVLEVRRIWAMDCGGTVVAGFSIERVTRGAQEWQTLTSLAE
jgi:cellulose synthase (UDP-forming)